MVGMTTALALGRRVAPVLTGIVSLPVIGGVFLVIWLMTYRVWSLLAAYAVLIVGLLVVPFLARWIALLVERMRHGPPPPAEETDDWSRLVADGGYAMALLGSIAGALLAAHVFGTIFILLVDAVLGEASELLAIGYFGLYPATLGGAVWGMGALLHLCGADRARATSRFGVPVTLVVLVGVIAWIVADGSLAFAPLAIPPVVVPFVSRRLALRAGRHP